MIQKNKSNGKLSPSKIQNTKNNNKQQNQQPLLKGKWDQKASPTPSPTKSKSQKNLRIKNVISLTKSKQKEFKENKQNKKKSQNSLIERQYTKQSFKRFQQKLNICTKIQQTIAQIKQREARLKSFFEIYRILESQAGHQRCLQHNNDLSLYCQTQNRVLCVHCIYGAHKHKTHKVLPLKDCGKQILKDNQNLQRNIFKDLQDIRIKIKISQTNESFIERHFRKQLQQLQKSYNEKIHSIEADFCEKKAYINAYFNEIIKKNSDLTKSLVEFQKNISVKMSVLKKDENPFKPVQGIKQISKQTILSKISDLSNINNLPVEQINQKDIGQNALRSRIKTPHQK